MKLSMQEKKVLLKLMGVDEKMVLGSMRGSRVSPRKKRVPSQTYKPWTQEDLEFIVQAKADEISTEKIARDLNRSVPSVQTIISRLRKKGVPVRTTHTSKLEETKRAKPDIEALKALCATPAV